MSECLNLPGLRVYIWLVSEVSSHLDTIDYKFEIILDH